MSEIDLKNSKITIVGLGLMGGSLGLALIANKVCREVVGLVRRQEAVTEALALGVVHQATMDPADAFQDADLVVFSTPIRTILWQMDQYSPYYKPGAIITDMGSTKQEIVQVMARLPDGVHPVGSHPMCGKELAGMAAAEATLYRHAPWVVTPLSRSSPWAVETVQQMAHSIGAHPLTLTPHRHDKLVATISHLPYTLAAALVLAAQIIANDDPTVWDVAAGGFRDTSRVAASDVTMMLDILLTNQDAVGQLIALARQQLDQFALAIAEGDEVGLRDLMERAAQQRRVMYQ